MSKTWYPVINREKCIECLACVDHCKHGVYELKDGSPYVAHPENCIEGCHGCGNKCPVEAIEYVGDSCKGKSNLGGCSCGGKC